MKQARSFRSQEYTPGYITMYAYFEDGSVLSTTLDGSEKAIVAGNGLINVRVERGESGPILGRPVSMILTHEHYEEPFEFTMPDTSLGSGLVYSPDLIALCDAANKGVGDFDMLINQERAKVYTVAEAIELRLNPRLARAPLT